MRGDVDDGPKAMSGVHEHSYSTGNSEHLNNMKLCSPARPNWHWLLCSMI